MNKKLNITKSTIKNILDLHKQYDTQDRDDTLDPVERLKQRYGNPDPLEMACHESIDKLTDEEKRELSALTWLGRGDFASFEEAMAHAPTVEMENVAGYLGSKPIYNYVPKGLEKAQSEGIEIPD